MDLLTRSIEIIRDGQAATGAYLASPTFSQYGYSWLRDGTWIAYGMDCAGQHDSARAFYLWVGHTLARYEQHSQNLLQKLERGETPQESDYLPTRFTIDGELGTDDWWDFQMDGYGTWLWGLVAHIELTGDHALWQVLQPAVALTIRYLEALWQTPNYDCWEEFRHEVHLSTLAAIYGGLDAVRHYAPDSVSARLPAAIRAFALKNGIAPEGHFMKFLGNNAVDANLLWTAMPYKLVNLDDPIFSRTLARIEQDIVRPGGGIYRYAADTYYGGGEWVLLTAWLGWTYTQLGRTEDAHRLLAWVEAQFNPDGTLPEQVSRHLLAPERYAEWEARWGTIACPLLWSHAMYLILRTTLDKSA
jgi:GH15 family glucan-1,4-alpha-glucosidase